MSNTSFAELQEALEAIQKAVDLVWNFRLHDAEQVLLPFVCHVPMAALHFAEISFLKAVLSEDMQQVIDFQERWALAKRLAATVLQKKGKKVPRAATVPLPGDPKGNDLSSRGSFDLSLSSRTASSSDLSETEMSAIFSGAGAQDDDDDEPLQEANGDPDVERVLRAREDATFILMARITQAEGSVWDAALKMKLQQQVKGVYNFRKSWNYFAKADALRRQVPHCPYVRELGSCIDAGLGFFHFIVSIIPKEWLWLVERIGFKGDRMRGLQQLEGSYMAQGFRSPTAVMHLVWISSFFFEDWERGEYWLKLCLEKYPAAAHMYYLGGYVYRKQGKVDEADVAFSMAITHGREIPSLVQVCEYDLASNMYLRLDWDGCVKLLEDFLYSADPPAPEGFKVFCAYQTAMCYEMLGDVECATAYFKLLLPWIRKNYEYDELVQRKAKHYLAHGGFSPYEHQYFIASVSFEACRYAEALEHMKKAEGLIQTVEDRGTYLYLIGSCLLQLGELDEAALYFKNAVALGKQIKVEKFVVPHCLTCLGEIAMHKDKKEQALRYFSKAKTYSNYDYSQLLGWRIQRNVEVLKDESMGTSRSRGIGVMNRSDGE